MDMFLEEIAPTLNRASYTELEWIYSQTELSGEWMTGQALKKQENMPNNDELIREYTPFIMKIAHKVKKGLNDSIELDDLFSYGAMGLLEAASRFDASKGANFMTFAYYRVRGAMYDGLRRMGWVNRSEYAKIKFEERATHYLDNVANRTMGVSERLTDPGSSVQELADKVSKLVTIYVTSLEAMEHAQFEDKKLKQSDDALYSQEMRHYLHEAIKDLSDDDRSIIVNYYYKDQTLAEVGEGLGLSKSWTSRKHAQAIDKLSECLEHYLNTKS